MGGKVGHREFFLRRRRPKTQIIIIFNFVGGWHLLSVRPIAQLVERQTRYSSRFESGFESLRGSIH